MAKALPAREFSPAILDRLQIYCENLALIKIEKIIKTCMVNLISYYILS